MKRNQKIFEEDSQRFDRDGGVVIGFESGIFFLRIVFFAAAFLIRIMAADIKARVGMFSLTRPRDEKIAEIREHRLPLKLREARTIILAAMQKRCQNAGFRAILVILLLQAR